MQSDLLQVHRLVAGTAIDLQILRLNSVWQILPACLHGSPRVLYQQHTALALIYHLSAIYRVTCQHRRCLFRCNYFILHTLRCDRVLWHVVSTPVLLWLLCSMSLVNNGAIDHFPPIYMLCKQPIRRTGTGKLNRHGGAFQMNPFASDLLGLCTHILLSIHRCILTKPGLPMRGVLAQQRDITERSRVFGTLKRNGLRTCGLRAVPGEWGARRSTRRAAACAVQVCAVCPDRAA